MGLKKKKNIIILTVIVVISFILYQMYFFLAISSQATNGNRIVQVLDQSKLNNEVKHIRSYEDKNINENGVIRGILYSNMPRFRPDEKEEFQCLQSEQRIPFNQVNDDYCDCADSTDEPSTSACVEGVFFCDNQYQNQQISLNIIPSSKVNDGICDCCDGSDEWLHESTMKLLTQGSLKLRRYYSTKCLNICFS